jgi:hypothetical protein
MGKIIDAATWLEKRWKQARDRWESQKNATSGGSQERQFTWLPKALALRIALGILLATTYFQSAGQSPGFTTLGGFFLIASLRYGWFLLNQSPMPDLRRDWWRNPGSVSVGACVLIYAFVHSGAEQTGNPERGRTSESSSSYSSSNTSSSSDEDARLLRNIERAMREGPTSRNDRPTYQFPNVGSCSSCGRRGTITTASGYTIACPDCGGRGYRTDGGGTPKTFPKYGQ